MVESRGHRRPLSLAAAVIVLVAIGLFVVDRQSPTLARPGVWQLVDSATPAFAADPGAPNGSVSVRAMISYGDGLLAVGTNSSDAGSNATVWTSSEGVAWSKMPAEGLSPSPEQTQAGSGTTLDFVTARGRRLVAYGMVSSPQAGSSSSRLAAWSSDDGLSWQRHDLPGTSSTLGDGPGTGSIRATPAALVSTLDGFMAFAIETADLAAGPHDALLVFRSPDGERWSRVDARGLEPRDKVFGAVVYRNQLVAFGSHGGRDGRAAAWTSADNGATWQTVALPYGGPLPFGTVEHSVLTPSGLLLIGGARTALLQAGTSQPNGPLNVEGQLHPVIWRSRDGVSFDELDTTALTTPGWDNVTAATTAGGGALLAIERTEPTGATTHLFSWSAKAGFVEEDAGEVATVSTLTEFRGAFIASAATSNSIWFDGRDFNTVVWRAPYQ